jgi:hypothetical protein
VASDRGVSAIEFIGVVKLIEDKDLEGFGKTHAEVKVPSRYGDNFFVEIQLLDSFIVFRLIIDFVS